MLSILLFWVSRVAFSVDWKPARLMEASAPIVALWSLIFRVLPETDAFIVVSSRRLVVPEPDMSEVSSAPWRLSWALLVIPLRMVSLSALDVREPPSILRSFCVIEELLVIMPFVLRVPAPEKVPVLFVPLRVKDPSLFMVPELERVLLTVIFAVLVRFCVLFRVC